MSFGFRTGSGQDWFCEGLLSRNGLFLIPVAGALHVRRLRRFGALLIPCFKEGRAGPGNERHEQEQDDDNR